MNSDEDVWVVIPARNEEKRISNVIDQVKEYSNNVVVVDDGSKDDTYDAAKAKKVIVLRHIINLGKGAAVKTGCDFVLKKNGKRIILIDADGQHEPKEIPRFLKSLQDADIVFGYRKISGQMPFVLRLGNWFINFATLVLYGLNLKDTQCGYRAFTADAYKKIRWKAAGYSMESEMIANVGKRHLRYKQIPIQTIYSDRYKGTTIMDGIKIVLNMFSWRLKK